MAELDVEWVERARAVLGEEEEGRAGQLLQLRQLAAAEPGLKVNGRVRNQIKSTVPHRCRTRRSST